MNLQSRINVLNKIKMAIDDIITAIENGTMKLSDVPFTKADIAAFLPAMKNLNTPLPHLLKESGANSYLNSLFPMFGAGDVSGAQLAKQFLSNYADTIFNNMSWDLSLHYVGKAEQDVAANYADAAEDMKIAADISQLSPGATPASTKDVSDKNYRGVMASVVQSMTGIATSGGSSSSSKSSKSSNSSSDNEDHSTFDWKTRSKQICQQISARGYTPYEFGCLDDPDNMKRESFSWRGYTKMVCNRLSTIYDPSVPFLCGCPPPTWPGWRQ